VLQKTQKAFKRGGRRKKRVSFHVLKAWGGVAKRSGHGSDEEKQVSKFVRANQGTKEERAGTINV